MSVKRLSHALHILGDLATSAAWRARYASPESIILGVASEGFTLKVRWPGNWTNSLFVYSADGEEEHFLCCESDEIASLIAPYCVWQRAIAFVVHAAMWCETQILRTAIIEQGLKVYEHPLFPHWKIRTVIITPSPWEETGLLRHGICGLAGFENKLLAEADPFGLRWITDLGYKHRPAPDGQYTDSSGFTVTITDGRGPCAHRLG